MKGSVKRLLFQILDIDDRDMIKQIQVQHVSACVVLDFLDEVDTNPSAEMYCTLPLDQG